MTDSNAVAGLVKDNFGTYCQSKKKELGKTNGDGSEEHRNQFENTSIDQITICVSK